MSSRNQLLEAALDYAARGMPVLPLHDVTTGRCSCRRPECGRVDATGEVKGSPGKHPRTKNGLKDATTDPETIRRWWRKWPHASIGLATGGKLNLTVLDRDPRHGGNESLAELEARHGKLPESVECETGGGGGHLYLIGPEGVRIGNSAGKLAPGVDIRGDGGYIVAPPSGHFSGVAYAWRPGHAPGEVPIAEAPAWLVDLAKAPGERRRPERERSRKRKSPKVVRRTSSSDELLGRALSYVDAVLGRPAGQRNTAAFQTAGHLASIVDEHGRGLSEADILLFMRDWNQRCAPSLEDDELARTVRNALVYGTPRAPKPPLAQAHRDGDGIANQDKAVDAAVALWPGDAREEVSFDQAPAAVESMIAEATAWARETGGLAVVQVPAGVGKTSAVLRRMRESPDYLYAGENFRLLAEKEKEAGIPVFIREGIERVCKYGSGVQEARMRGWMPRWREAVCTGYRMKGNACPHMKTCKVFEKLPQDRPIFAPHAALEYIHEEELE